jgi:SAM-dependent methyltransferase
MSQTRFDGQAARALEATYQTPDLIAQRARTLDLLAPRAGERILDVGVGPGLLAYDLARLAGPDGRVVGIDVSEDMLALARERLRELPQAQVLRADALDLGLPDAAFDAAVSTQVHEYVADMPRALAELHRVLRPGGRLLMLDTDWRSIVWHSSDERRMARVLDVWDGHLADPHLPARLGPLLREAGFEVRRVEAFPILAPEWRPVGYAAGIVTSIRDYALRHGPARGLSEAEIAEWWADHEAQVAAGRFFFSLNRYLFLATR